MTALKRPEVVDMEARRAPPWCLGSRTTEAKERIREQARGDAAVRRRSILQREARRAAIAKLMLARRSR